MRLSLRFGVYVLTLITLLPGDTQAGDDTIGPNGINSARLQLFGDGALSSNGNGTRANEVRKILLKDIWALNTPGTRKLTPEPRCPDGTHPFEEAQLLEGIYHSLYVLKPDTKLDPAFAVSGVGLEAMRNAHDVMAKRKRPARTFATNEEVSIVFFATGRGLHVYVQEVERRGAQVCIRYRYVPHLVSPLTTLHFAIIPVGKLPAGNISVEMTQLPTDKKILASTYMEPKKEFTVCGAFEFFVKVSHAK